MNASDPPRPPSDEVDPDEFEDVETVTTRVTEVRMSRPDSKTRNRATLTVVSGPDTGRVHSLGPSVTIGRARTCEIALDEPSISRTHARVTCSGDGNWWLVDLQSRNGTYVDGFRVDRHRLQDGDRLQLGPVIEFRYAITDDDGERLLRELYESSVRDPLTGVYNRKHLTERLVSELSYCLRHRTEVAVLLFDIDHFKRVNDTWGHLAGDLVLKSVATLVGRTIRTEDILARYGGEEFVVIARDTGAVGALALAERIRSVVESTVTQYERTPIRVTVSVGVATSLSCAGKLSPEAIIGAADRNLYAAKDRGRNRVIGPAPR